MKKYGQASMESQKNQKKGQVNHNLVNITTLSTTKKPKQKILVAKMVSKNSKTDFKFKKPIRFNPQVKETKEKGGYGLELVNI